MSFIMKLIYRNTLYKTPALLEVTLELCSESFKTTHYCNQNSKTLKTYVISYLFVISVLYVILLI